MRAYKTNRDRPNRIESAIVTADTRTSEPKLVGLLNLSSRPGQHRRLVRSTQTPPRQRNQVVGLPASIDGLPSLVHHLVQDVLAELQSDEIARDADIRSLLPITLEKMADRMRGLAPRRNAEPGPPSAAVELISSVDPSVRLAALRTETTLRVGALELDLIDRTARRGDRQIDLRPREFLLLKYMVQRSDKLLTRATAPERRVALQIRARDEPCRCSSRSTAPQGRRSERGSHDPQHPRRRLRSKCQSALAGFAAKPH